MSTASLVTPAGTITSVVSVAPYGRTWQFVNQTWASWTAVNAANASWTVVRDG